jgi:hypothetical protein
MRAFALDGFPVILGRDFAGVVEQAGPGAERYAVGDNVFGYVKHADPGVGSGSWAELIAVPDTTIARRPEDVGLAVAGATPLAGITALYSVDALGLEADDSPTCSSRRARRSPRCRRPTSRASSRSASPDAAHGQVIAGVERARAGVDVGDDEGGARPPRRVAQQERVLAAPVVP